MSDFFCLPEALLMNIWLRLPIKSTVRFRCVSKSWCASLSDPHFIYKNLTLFDAENQNENDLLLVLDHERDYYSVVSHETLVATPLRVLPLREAVGEDLGEVLGADDWCIDDIEVQTYCCHDLICFHDEEGESIGVWNLTTGETKMLPLVSDDLFEFVALGFGFDDKIMDYKMVHIGYYQGDFGVCVYSLRSGNNCWRKLDKPNVRMGRHYYDPFCRSYSYRDGIFYWYESNRHLIISFDMCSEVFNTSSIPQLPDPFKTVKRICKLKDGSMFLISFTYEEGHIYDLWVLLEVGVSPSFTKLFRIDWHCGNEMLSPLGFWRNELVFGISGERLIIGDPSSKQEPKEVEIDKALECLSCLVWTKGKNSVAAG